MEKFDPIDIDFILNNDQVKKSTEQIKADLKSVGQTAEETAAKVNKQIGGAFEAAAPGINATNEALEKQNAIVNRSKPQWNGLGNSINQITRELPAFSLSAQTGFLAISNNIPILADEIGRLSAKNKELALSGEKTVPIWKQVAKGFFSWGTALSAGVVLLTVYGREFVDFIGKLFKGKDAFDVLKNSITSVNKAFESNNYQKVIKDVEELRSYINLAKEGIIDKNIALKKYNETLGDVVGEVDNLAAAEKDLIDKAPAYIEAMLYKAAAAEATSEAAKKIAENQKRQFEIEEEKAAINARTNKEVSGGYNPTSPGSVNVSGLKAQSDLNKANAEIDALEKEATDLQTKTGKVIDNLNKKAAEIAKANGLNIFGGDEGDKNKTVSAYQSLLDKLTALDKEYSRKSFTKDEEELQALKDKFETIRTLVQRFNADPKNKAQIIDLSNLDQLENSAIESLTYRQTTDKLKEELEQQKKLYADFETYKKQFGAAAAEKEFEGKLNSAKSYYDYLKQVQKENIKAYEAVDNGTATGAEVERVQFLNKALKAESDTQKKLFDQQLAQLLSYQKKRALLIETYNEKYKALIEAGKGEEAEVLKAAHEEELNALDDTNVKKLASYKALFNGIVGMTARQVKKVIADMRKILETEKMSAEMQAAILERIAKLDKLLKENALNDIYKYGMAIGQLGAALSELGQSLGSRGLADGGALLSGLASSLNEVLTIFDKESSSADKITAGISGAIKLIGVFTSAAQQRKQAEEEYYLAVIGFQNEYNLSLQEQIRLRSILDENVFIKDYEGRIKDALASLSNANTEYEKALQNLMDNGRAKIGQRNAVDWGSIGTAAGSGAAVGAAVGSVVPVIGTLVGAIGGALIGAIGGLFGGKKKKDQYGDILAEYPELIQQSEDGLLRINKELAESLINNNLVNKETKQILENILEWEKALDDARKQIKEVIAELTGNLSADLKTNLVDAFVTGENAAIKMGKTVEKVLENILSSLIFNRVFDNAFSQLEEQMSESFDIGGDGSWIDDFARFFSSASALTDDFNAAMAAAQQEAANFGFDIFKPESPTAQPGLAGAIRRELTEETGGELAGILRGQYDVTRSLFESAEAYYERERQHHNSLLDLITINTNIERNTFNTVEELKLSVVELKSIAENTKNHYLLDLGT